jgi:hypothetical protein
MTELESLISRAADLGGKVDFWNTAVLYSLLATAIVGAVLFFSQRQSNNRAKQFADAMTEISSIKDTQLANLRKDAADARKAQQDVELKLATQQEKAAAAEQSLLQLQRRIEPRRLSTEQQSRLIKILTTHTQGNSLIAIISVHGDSESIRFANDVASVLRAAGWVPGALQAEYAVAPTGFVLVVQNAKSPPPIAVELQKAFFEIGIPLAGVSNPNLADQQLQIIVGTKPDL